MSDENAETGGSHEDARPASQDPGLDARLDDVHRVLSTLGMRVDALVTSTTTYRSALTERLSDYADVVSELTRTQAADLEEYRRVVAEVRAMVGAQTGTGSGSGTDGSAVDAVEAVGDQILARIADTQATTLEQLEEIRSVVQAGDRRDTDLETLLTPLRDGLERIDDRLGDPARDKAVIERLADRLAGLEERISALAESDQSAAVADRFDTVHTAIELLATADQVGALAADLRAQLIDAIGPLDAGAVMDTLAVIERELTSSSQVAAESWGEFAGLRAKVDAILETSANETGTVSQLLDEIRETLLDVASGEVVGALWDEFRDARSSIDELIATVARVEDTNRSLADSVREATETEPVPAEAQVDATEEDLFQRLEGLRADVSGLDDAVRDLLAQAELIEEPAEEPERHRSDAMMVAVAADVSALRRELSQGLVVEPSDALAGAVDQLRGDVTRLDERLGALGGFAEALDELRAAARAGQDEPGDGDDVADELRSVREDVSGVSQGIVGLGEQFGDVRERIDGLGDALVDITGRVDAVTGQVDAVTGQVDAVTGQVDAVTGQVDGIGALERSVTALRDELGSSVESLRSELRAAEPADESVGTEDLEGELAVLRTGVDSLGTDLATVRIGIDDIIERLDEGLVLAEADESSTSSSPDLVDQFAGLRDQINAEFDALRQLIDGLGTSDEHEDRSDAPPVSFDLSAVTELLEAVRDDIAELPDRIDIPAPPAPVPAPAPAPDALDQSEFATVDPDVIDLLREEIRAAGAVPDDLLDQLRKELIALRRRIKLRADGEILSDEQLRSIADAVAARLAE